MKELVGTRIPKKLKTRIIRDAQGYYDGYIYIEDLKAAKESDKNTILLDICLDEGWNNIVKSCMTQLGCRLEIKRKIKQHTVKEGEIKL